MTRRSPLVLLLVRLAALSVVAVGIATSDWRLVSYRHGGRDIHWRAGIVGQSYMRVDTNATHAAGWVNFWRGECATDVRDALALPKCLDCEALRKEVKKDENDNASIFSVSSWLYTSTCTMSYVVFGFLVAAACVEFIAVVLHLFCMCFVPTHIANTVKLSAVSSGLGTIGLAAYLLVVYGTDRPLDSAMFDLHSRVGYSLLLAAGGIVALMAMWIAGTLLLGRRIQSDLRHAPLNSSNLPSVHAALLDPTASPLNGQPSGRGGHGAYQQGRNSGYKP